jgi:hypothetical protein
MPLTISFYEFSISKPYHEGFAISQAEAQILNTAKRDALAAQGAKELAKMRPQGEQGLLSSQQLEALTLLIADLDMQFAFKLRPNPRPRSGTLNQEIQLVAMERVEAEARKLGLKLSSQQFEAAVQEWRADGAIIGEARRRFEERLKINTMPLSELFGEQPGG